MIYKVSYVVRGKAHPGAILDASRMPQAGDKVSFGGVEFLVEEVIELMPPRGGFGFLHATCAPFCPQENSPE
jgi:hypothetical protein